MNPFRGPRDGVIVTCVCRTTEFGLRPWLAGVRQNPCLSRSVHRTRCRWPRGLHEPKRIACTNRGVCKRYQIRVAGSVDIAHHANILLGPARVADSTASSNALAVAGSEAGAAAASSRPAAPMSLRSSCRASRRAALSPSHAGPAAGTPRCGAVLYATPAQAQRPSRR